MKRLQDALTQSHVDLDESRKRADHDVSYLIILNISTLYGIYPDMCDILYGEGCISDLLSRRVQ